MYQGCTVAICEGLRYIMRDLAESKAEVIVGVPLVFEKMHRNIMKTARRAGKYDLLRGLINFAKLAEGRIPPRALFRSVHKALGGHMKLFLVGGAPCDPGIISDFNAMGIRMIQGYGMTESSPIISVGKDRCSRDASVGLPLHGIFVQIDDANAEGIGEIVIAGPSVMSGYYGDEAATKEAMPDGRLRTGDLGRFDEDGFMYITGRKKNLIVLKSGKNVYPEEVEYYLSKSRYIEESVVSGADGGAVVHAEIFPDVDAIERDFGEADTDDICKIIDREVDRANESMPPHMSVRRIALRTEPFEKTTTKKIRRENKE
jgi:long-chain acyl-CoA synthetase